MFSLIESKTNEKIRRRTETLTKHKEHLFESSTYPWKKPTNIFELRALIGLLYFRSLFGMNHHSLNILFSDNPVRHQIAFRQYNPLKPHRYGLLLKSLNEASFPYTYKACPYAGKPEKGEGSYNIDSTDNYVRYLVNQTANDTELQGRNISMDCLYTSMSLDNWLFGRKVTCVGTLNHNR